MDKVDLHTHTCYSADGEIRPREIVSMAKKKGLKAIAITDHDTVDGLEEALQTGEEEEIEVIPGIEFDTKYKEENLHILGYYLDWHDNRLIEITKNIRDKQYQQAKERVKLLQEMDFAINWEDVEEEANIIPVGGIIAKVLLNNGLNDKDPRLEPYYNGQRSDQPYFNFYLDYFLPGKPASVPANMPDSRDIIALIKELNGIAVLAHPGSAINLDDNEEILYELIDSGLDGMEAYSTYHSIKENEEFAKWAANHQMLITAGSDFHGHLKPDIELGGIEKNNYSIVEEMKSKFLA
ncbi:PHP domain-containing protein [Selenihalanaerobacter shriftii]|uniref:Polymerase/histidinol phosphatase N-terminal domain-containing protein n=1 Tax=Selenihalanaerobacter shriftii TaxID=142842 RepID=A0A1T4PNN0_9FIRM|nr:PHP domain-containing protein [Selenihalanaerobacter shriftii]SJZ93215.1 hypothetical protein SAMN02745118_02255 [Selenihalanaerobacter shriftii]